MTVDPLAHLRPGLSPYNYVQNNPLNRFDPDGRLDGGLTAGTVVLVGGAAVIGVAWATDSYLYLTNPYYRAQKDAGNRGILKLADNIIDGALNLFSSDNSETDKSKAPPANDGESPQHGNEDHDDKIKQKAKDAKEKGNTDIRKNQAQVDAKGNKVGNNRPDLQSTDPKGQRQIYEVDRSPKSSQNHVKTINKNDPNATVETEIIK